MESGQEWCLQCGAGAPGSLRDGPGWGPLAAIAGVTVLLLAGAAAAAYAALTHSTAAPVHHVVEVVPPPTSTVPPTGTPSTPGATVPPTIPKTHPFTPGRVKVPPIAANSAPPPIPLNIPPTTTSGTTTPPTATTPTGATPTTSTPTTTPTTTTPTTTPQPSPIELDTDAASTYDPYNYPASDFGDPSLAIDGEPSTAWTAQVDPAVAPRMAEGLAIDLKSSRRLASVTLRTSTPGMVVGIYGANGGKPPASITDPAWKQLTLPRALKKKQSLKLNTGGRAYRFVVVWITQAPAASVGTPQAPGRVSLNEVELFPLSK